MTQINQATVTINDKLHRTGVSSITSNQLTMSFCTAVIIYARLIISA